MPKGERVVRSNSLKKKKSAEPYKFDGKVRVKNSYYTFSREYPKGYITGRKKRKKTGRVHLRRILLALCFVMLTAATFFVADLGLKISYAPMKDSDAIEAPAFDGNTVIREKGLRALYMPYGKLGDEGYIKDIIKKAVRSDMNSVVIEFKTPEGKLCYSCLNEYAIAAKASVFDNDTVRRAVSLFGDGGITIVAKISCFRDPTVASAAPELAVKYMDTDVNWLDGSDEKGGKPWLNPYSADVTMYLLGIVSDLRGFGINCFILDDVQFPESENTQGATYPYEGGERNSVLKSFIENIKASGDEKTLFFLWQSANEALGGDDIYYGKLNDSAVDGIIYDLSERPESYVIDKKTDYVSILSLHSALKGMSSDKISVPVVDSEDNSYSYRRVLKKNGYTSIVLRSKDGEY